MNLTIKDLSASTELDQAAMTAVCGASRGNSAVSNIGQFQTVETPVTLNAGMGSSVNADVSIHANQDARILTDQNNGNFDLFSFLVNMPGARRAK